MSSTTAGDAPTDAREIEEKVVQMHYSGQCIQGCRKAAHAIYHLKMQRLFASIAASKRYQVPNSKEIPFGALPASPHLLTVDTLALQSHMQNCAAACGLRFRVSAHVEPVLRFAQARIVSTACLLAVVAATTFLFF